MLLVEMTGVKGGAGRSTLSSLLSLSLAYDGFNVSLIDLDDLGWSSRLLEVNDKGLICIFSDRSSSGLWKEIRVNKGKIRVIKMLEPCGMIDDRLDLVFNDSELRGRLTKILNEAVRGSQVIVVDSKLALNGRSNNLAELIYEAIPRNVSYKRIYVTDFNRLSIEATLEVMRLDQKAVDGVVINMIPPLPSFAEQARSLATRFKGIVTIFPFLEYLFNVSTLPMDNVPDQIRRLSKHLLEPTPSFLLVI
ncbi:MAG: hypothetical protein QXR57_05885 [Metallosphaera sp.]|uniref:nucleotide-binding protein n=1 Tax=Metallosphaera sp. TaxID=2020860 RepID=UPI003169A2B4